MHSPFANWFRQRPGKTRPRRRGHFESLERRELLASLVITGTDRADTLVLRIKGDSLDVVLNGATANTPRDQFTDVVVDLAGGDDLLIVDSAPGAIDAPIEFDGGTGFDGLRLEGGLASSDLYTVGPDPGAGLSQIVIGGVTQVVRFQNLEPIIDTVAAPSLVVNGTATNNQIAYTVGPNSGTALVGFATTGQVAVDAFEATEFANKSILVINGLGGADTFNLNNPDQPTGLTQITVDGGDDNDQFNVTPTLVPIQINGGASTATGDSLSLTLTGVTNPQQAITSGNSGQFNFGNRQPVGFAGMESVHATPIPEVTLNLDVGAIPESGGVVMVTATLSAITSVNVTVSLAFAGLATNGVDYTASATELLIPAGFTTGPAVTLTASDDSLVEGDEPIVVRVAGVANAFSNGPQPKSVAIIDADTATVAFQAATTAAPEDGGAVNITLVLNTAPGNTLANNQTLQVTATNGSAGNADYDAAAFPKSVTFAAGQGNGDTQPTTFVPTSDTFVEGPETVTLGLNTVGSLLAASGQTTNLVTIADADAATVAFQSATTSAPEDGGAVNITLVLNTAPGNTLAANQTLQVTATNGSAGSADYDAAAFPKSVTFTAGQGNGDTQLTTFVPTSDTFVEGPETVTLGLNTAGSLLAASGPTTNLVTIADADTATVAFQAATTSAPEDGGAVNITLVLSTAPGNTLETTQRVRVTATNGSAENADYDSGLFPKFVTFAVGQGNGGTQATMFVPASDTLVEGSETVTLGLDTTGSVLTASGQTTNVATVVDADVATISLTAAKFVAEIGGGQTIAATLNTVGGAILTPEISVSVNLVDAGGGTASANDYAALGTQILTFAGGSGDGTTQNGTITPANDRRVEGDESVFVRLQNLSSTLNGQLSLAVANGTVTIVDDDTATVEFVNATDNVAEDTTTRPGQTVRLRLTTQGSGTPGLDRDIVVGIATGGTAANAAAPVGDFSFTPISRMFARGTDAPIPDVSLDGIAVFEDQSLEGNESATLNLSVTAGPAEVGANGTHTLTIVDDDVTSVRRYDAPIAGDYRLRRQNGNIEILQNGVVVSREPDTGLFGLTFNRTTGRETMTLDFTGGLPIPMGGVQYFGAADGDALRVMGAVSDSVIYRPSGVDDGQLDFITAVFNFENAASLDIADMSAVTLASPATNDVVRIAEGFDNATGLVPALVLSDGGNPLFPFLEAHAFRNALLTVDTFDAAAEGRDSVVLGGAANLHGNQSLFVRSIDDPNRVPLIPATPDPELGDTITVAGSVRFNGRVTFRTAGAVTMQPGSRIESVGDDVVITAALGVAVTELIASAGDVTVDSRLGGIAGVGNTRHIQAANSSLSAATSIGSCTAVPTDECGADKQVLRTDVGDLQATAHGLGVFLTHTGMVTVNTTSMNPAFGLEDVELDNAPVGLAASPEPWEAEDVNGDGRITPLDALLIVNSLLARSAVVDALFAAEPDWTHDVNADGIVSALDALTVIRVLNERLQDPTGFAQGVPDTWTLRLHRGRRPGAILRPDPARA